MVKAYCFSTVSGIPGGFWVDGVNLKFCFPVAWDLDYSDTVEIGRLAFEESADDLSESDLITFALQNFTPNDPIVESTVKPSLLPLNCYYPRVWRGLLRDGWVSSSTVSNSKVYGSSYISSVVAAENIFSYLTDIFKFIDPDPRNLECYGARLRELLILACTEVESLWKGVLRANSLTKKEYFNTGDYYSVCGLLRLKEWSIYLKDYPGLGDFSPFSCWDSSSPSKSIAWYDAYNAVKHDREASSHQATLRHVINAVAAIHVLSSSQWGPEIYSVLHDNRFTPFAFRGVPVFEAGEIYVIDGKGDCELMPFKYFAAN